MSAKAETVDMVGLEAPVEILIDRDGRVIEARNGFGYKKKWARKLEAKLVELLTESPRRGVDP